MLVRIFSNGYQMSVCHPEIGFLTCNYDVTYNLHTSQVWGAWIVRNSQCQPEPWGSDSLGLAQSSLAAKAKALFVAMLNVWTWAFRNVIFEGTREFFGKIS
ncbi:unnamed protein product [Eruca vesicaria subsp. sativa]|uniref:RNase H type-1 domain-containing protein n=1 Tax=Eruca vesicaria subsp. sativa TaxID=29727 RepID=A0ABC8JVR1_ERUVS|nr:unnamed protein product [Eruca vesicaria subsp. sativa]